MRVNHKKTQLLCVSANASGNTSSYIKYNGEKILSGSELKILGFVFGQKPTVRPHVDYMLAKARKKLWALRHLKRAGLSESDLLSNYYSLVRSTLEYAAPTFHPMLSAGMSDELEYIQKRACKLIFGWDASYNDLVSNGKIETLKSRRNKLTLNFAKKCEKNPRFKPWFAEKDYSNLNLREERRFEELFARTERLKNSPLFYMRRALNDDCEEN